MIKNEISVYVDGSYDPYKGVYGSSFVALLPDGNVATYLKAGNNLETARFRNVSGEMIAAMSAVSYAIKEGYAAVKILYDYLGIECWATGAWKARKSLSSEYARFMRSKKNDINITFQKVPAHQNVEYNEIADRLAKRAIFDFCIQETID